MASANFEEAEKIVLEELKKIPLSFLTLAFFVLL